MTQYSWRNFLLVFFFLHIGAAAAFAGENQGPPWRHASALGGTPKYPPDFPHFDYVNPDAPKEGMLRLSDSSGFSSFNPILPKDVPASGLGLMYDTLTTYALDEVDISAEYGLIASSIRYPENFSWVEFRLNPDAYWHDGMPISVEDVIYSFNKLVEHNPNQKAYYANVSKVEARGDDIVRFSFDVENNVELPKILGQLLILPKHWWEGIGPDGKKRDLGRTTLEPPLGSGPYRIAGFEAERNVVYRRVEDYWAKDHPARIGQNNFDEIRYEVFKDRTVRFESFKGDNFDYLIEYSSKNWATGYDIPAVFDGRIKREEFPDKSSGIMQAFFINLRKDKFSDPRVRQALNYAYDFETANKTIFYNLYKRNNSFFQRTEFASSGMAEGAELEILEELRGKIPDSVFSKPYENPVAGDPARLRTNLREAVRLLSEAGYSLKNGQMIFRETGAPLTIEFIENDSNAERYVLPYAANLKKIGIEMTLRIVDTSQYIARLRERDFDMTLLAIGQSLSPGNEQRGYWGSEAADKALSRNYGGISDPAIDILIDNVIFAEDRDELLHATRALDRVLMHNHFVVPAWYNDVTFTARWDRFSHPENLPIYSPGFPAIWWWDAQKAKIVEEKNQ